MPMRMWERRGDRSDEGETSRLTAADPDLSPAVAAEVGEASKRAALRAAVLESLKGCGIPIMRIDKEELRRRIVIPERLRRAMWDATRKRDKEPASAVSVSVSVSVDEEEEEEDRVGDEEEEEEAPETPVIVFINSRSGGRQGTVLKGKLLEFVGEEQIMDLTVVKPSDFIQYGLACLEKLSDLGDDCAKSTRERLRIVVAGGDGTVGWVLGCLGELYLQNREPVPPTGIIPLGTGNDLSRSFGWGGSFPFAWKSAVKRALYRVSTGPICHLDSWHVVVSTPHGEEVDLPHSLRRMGQCTFTQDEDIEGELPEKVTCFEGDFYNYFSIGMDAQVAYGFHQLRDEKPHLAQSAIANKLIYTGYSCAQGWFLTPCINDPSLRGLKNILRISIKKLDSSDWEQIEVPSSVRAVVALNLHNYGSGRNPWGQLKPEYLEKRGFVEASSDDGLLEIFGLKQGWHATFVMVELISAKHIAQAAGIRLEIRGGQWKEAYLQMDGEPWKQPLSNRYSSFVEIIRVPFQSILIKGE